MLYEAVRDRNGLVKLAHSQRNIQNTPTLGKPTVTVQYLGVLALNRTLLWLLCKAQKSLCQLPPLNMSTRRI